MATVARLLHSSAAPQADVGLSQVAIPEQQVNFPCLDNMEERAMVRRFLDTQSHSKH